MLLIDRRRQVRSVAPRHLPVPFVVEWFRHDQARVHSLFQWCQTDLGFIQALSEELHRCLGRVPYAQPNPDALIAAAAQAIASGLIDVASMLPDDVVVRFDNNFPFEWGDMRTVAFADQASAARFVAAALNTRQNRAAFEAALAHPEAPRREAAPQTPDELGLNGRMPDADLALIGRVSAFLTARDLGLIPNDLPRRVLRLVWLEHKIAVASGASAPPPPSPSPPPPTPPPAPASKLADAPDDISPQAQTLIDAAETGAPFCEECARRAAELANA